MVPGPVGIVVVVVVVVDDGTVVVVVVVVDVEVVVVVVVVVVAPHERAAPLKAQLLGSLALPGVLTWNPIPAL
jgi:hypothetical protein